MKVIGRILLSALFILLGIGAIKLSVDKIMQDQIFWSWLSGIFFGLGLIVAGVAIAAGRRLRDIMDGFL